MKGVPPASTRIQIPWFDIRHLLNSVIRTNGHKLTLTYESLLNTQFYVLPPCLLEMHGESAPRFQTRPSKCSCKLLVVLEVQMYGGVMQRVVNVRISQIPDGVKTLLLLLPLTVPYFPELSTSGGSYVYRLLPTIKLLIWFRPFMPRHSVDPLTLQSFVRTNIECIIHFWRHNMVLLHYYYERAQLNRYS